jgi:hypothetical protein
MFPLLLDRYKPLNMILLVTNVKIIIISHYHSELYFKLK